MDPSASLVDKGLAVFDLASPVSSGEIRAGARMVEGVMASVRSARRGGDDVTDVFVSPSRYPESAEHIRDAQAAGHPGVLTLDRAGAGANRTAAQAGQAHIKA